MADYGLHSGGEEVFIYWLADDHSGITTDGSNAATNENDAILAITTGLATPTFNVDSFTLELFKHDDTVDSFIKTHASSISASEVDGEVGYSEAGTKWDVDADAAGSTQCLIVYKGNLSGQSGKRKFIAGIGTLNAESNNYTTQYKQWSRKTLVFTPVQAKQAVAIAAAFMPSGFGAAVTATIASGAIWEQAFLSTT